MGDELPSFTGAAALVSRTARGREVTVTRGPRERRGKAPFPQQEALLASQLGCLVLPW